MENSSLMLYGANNFHAILKDDAILPPVKGSTSRGVFGRAPNEVVYALEHQECPICLLRRKCLCLEVFDLPPDSRKSRRPALPHPFGIEPPSTLHAHSGAGGWELTELLPLLKYAGKVYLGKAATFGGGKMHIETEGRPEEPHG